jgi:hypothetical protein
MGKERRKVEERADLKSSSHCPDEDFKFYVSIQGENQIHKTWTTTTRSQFFRLLKQFRSSWGI